MIKLNQSAHVYIPSSLEVSKQNILPLDVGETSRMQISLKEDFTQIHMIAFKAETSKWRLWKHLVFGVIGYVKKTEVFNQSAMIGVSGLKAGN